MTADGSDKTGATAAADATDQPRPGSLTPAEAALHDARDAVIAGKSVDAREKFLPVTRYALVDRLASPRAWPQGDAGHVRRLFKYLDCWRRVSYLKRMFDLEQNYEPFSPDTDQLITRKFTADERADMQRRVVVDMEELLTRANFTRISSSALRDIMNTKSHLGLELDVDLSVFEEILVYYRGSIKRTETRRNKKKLFLTREKYEVSIFQRLFVLFKLKPVETRVREVMAEQRCSRRDAEKIVRKLRRALPAKVETDAIYMKLFKDIPHADLEMVFPNTRIKMPMFDKVKFGATAGSGIGAGIFGAASKLAIASNPVAMASAVGGFGLIAMRQGTNFINQRNRYMLKMAQSLYFHSMADNSGVMTLLANRAADQDVKEEMLLYSVLAKETVNIRDIGEVDLAIEQYLLNTFGVNNFDFEILDALQRLEADGLVTRSPDGMLKTLAPNDAALHIDKLWDSYLDDLPDPKPGVGVEFDGDTGAPATA